MKVIFVTFVGDDYKWPIAVGYNPRSDKDICFVEKSAYDELLERLKKAEEKMRETREN